MLLKFRNFFIGKNCFVRLVFFSLLIRCENYIVRYFVLCW